MPKVLLDVPEWWNPGNCPRCRMQKCPHWRVGRVIVKHDCPLANAKEAVVMMGQADVDKAVRNNYTLYAVKEEK